MKRTSTEIASIAKHVGEERAIELVAKAGFDAWDFSMFDLTNPEHPLRQKNYIKYVKELRKIYKDFQQIIYIIVSFFMKYVILIRRRRYI